MEYLHLGTNLEEECPRVPTRNASQALKDAYDRWTKANDKDQVYILASLFDFLTKKHEVMMFACQIMESLKDMFGQSSIQIRHEALKYIYNVHMKESQLVKEHVLDLMTYESLLKGKGLVEGEANVAHSRNFHKDSSSGTKSDYSSSGPKKI
ncbi:uncharacterized protein LOC120077202 [Benincasa hispida]|uniref:uncharacterized protein LOC120077202 n=1 Tax=Benincasa hispida TaxID=102211 RepID=UPI0019017931|nr:uncharacterized protein LOC120077202 [Benincasa hispida]